MWLGDPRLEDATTSAITLRWRKPPPPPGSPLTGTCVRYRAAGTGAGAGAGEEPQEEAEAEAGGGWSELELPHQPEALATLDVDTWTVPALQSATDYEFGVRLSNANGWGAWSHTRGRTRGPVRQPD